MNAFLTAYAEAALWSSNIFEGDEENPGEREGKPFDDYFGIDDLSPDCLKQFEDDCEDFQEANKELLEKSGLSDEQAGQDFWLTRNRHGAGFWDRGLGEIGKKLSEDAKIYGTVNLWIEEIEGEEKVSCN
jgi:hypothetical protein